MVKNANSNISVGGGRDTFESDTAPDPDREFKSTFNADNSELFPNKIINPLHKFNSFNTIFTLACLTPEEINFPQKLRLGPPTYTILRSGGSGKSKISTIYDTNFDGGLASAREYFINDLEFSTVIGPLNKNNTNLNKINFTVFEPLSLGTFIETLRQAGLKAGHKNYVDAPFALIMEFVGIDANNESITVTDISNKNLKRVIPIKLNNIDMSVTQSGTNYSIVAMPVNDYAQLDSIRTIKNDMTLRGFTVQDLLQRSFQEENNKYKKAGNQKYNVSQVADDIIINFPTAKDLTEQSTKTGFVVEPGATSVDANQQRTQVVSGTGTTVLSTPWSVTYEQSPGDMNEIGKSSMNFVDDQFKNVVNSDEKKYFNAKKKIAVTTEIQNQRIGELTFRSGTTIEDVITSVLMYTDYAQNLLQDSDSSGFKKWFKINTRVFWINDPEVVKVSGKYPKLIVYDVVEHNVHESLFVRPNVKTKTAKLNHQVSKEYDYMYTGKNLDVLKFDININLANTLLMAADSANSKKDPNRTSRVNPHLDSFASDSPGDTEAEAIGSGVTNKTGLYANARRAALEPIGELTDEQRLAFEFHDYIMSGSHNAFLRINLDILGDPYYILDSGIGNYMAQSEKDPLGGSELKFINKDGSADTIFKGVYVVLNFRTPVDYASSGTMVFGDTGSELNKKFVPLPMFSGVYQVLSVTNIFKNGTFTQTLDMSRLANQEATTTTNTPTASAIQAGEENPEIE